MFEGGFVGYGGDDKPVEQPVAEVHSVELVAELVKISFLTPGYMFLIRAVELDMAI